MKISVLLCLLTVPALAHESDIWEWTVESGYLWNVGNNTEIDYEIVPTQFTLRSPVVWQLWENAAGAKCVVRNRFSALFETITRGPEDAYLGLNAAPSVELWLPSQRTSAYFSVGGGFGWTNSSGGEQGLGQDLTFNWFAQLGIRQKITENLSLLAGPYFIHHSNLGLTDPNPGIDAFGFTIGCSWKF
jgi:lipid A 3-O-deacylase